MLTSEGAKYFKVFDFFENFRFVSYVGAVGRRSHLSAPFR
jgi:hypothetical protein